MRERDYRPPVRGGGRHYAKIEHQRWRVAAIPDGGRVVVAPRGEIDLGSVDLLRRHLSELEDGGFHSVVLDLRNVTFMDSTGLHLVLAAVRKDGINFAVIPGTAQVQRVFEITGLIDQVPLAAATGARQLPSRVGPGTDG